MKTRILLILLMTLGLTANSNSLNSNQKIKVNSPYRLAQPIVFVENGVEFLIFPDGSFEFSELNEFYVEERVIDRRAEAMRVRQSPGEARNVRFVEQLRGPAILYGRNGLVTSINNIRLYYDAMNRIIQIGSVNMDYQRGNGRLRSVGGLKVNYNGRGEIVHVKGFVNEFNQNSVLYSEQMPLHLNEESFCDDCYYYKKNGKLKKHKKLGKK